MLECWHVSLVCCKGFLCSDNLSIRMILELTKKCARHKFLVSYDGVLMALLMLLGYCVCFLDGLLDLLGSRSSEASGPGHI